MNSTTAPIRVLVIDDNPEILAAVNNGLTLMGNYEVITATDGVYGLESVFTVQPDCVIVDVRMPHLNGYQFVLAMRGDPQTDQIPIIILSALVQDRDELMGMLTGADAYLRKPCLLYTSPSPRD